MDLANMSLSHVAVCVRDLQRSREFYSTLLGFEESPRPEIEDPGVWYQLGTQQLHLMERKGLIEDARGLSGYVGGHFALQVPTNVFHEVTATLRERGVEFLIDPTLREEDQCWAAFVLDPDGNIIEITDLRATAV